MRLEFQYTPQDVEEALHAMQAQRTRQAKIKAKKTSRGWTMAIGAVIGLLVVPIFSAGSWMRVDPYGNKRPPFFFVLNVILPLIVVALYVLSIALMQRKHGVRGATRSALAGVIWALMPLGIIAATVLGLRLLVRALGQGSAPDQSRYDWVAILLPQATWAVLLAMMTMLVSRQNRQAAQRTWDAQPSLRRPRIVEIDDRGIFIDETVEQRRYEWIVILRVIETANLFLLCPSEITFEMLPKRVFASLQELETARAILNERITDRAGEPQGFAVVTAPPAS
jgi:hypothetical protein